MRCSLDGRTVVGLETQVACIRTNAYCSYCNLSPDEDKSPSTAAQGNGKPLRLVQVGTACTSRCQRATRTAKPAPWVTATCCGKAECARRQGSSFAMTLSAYTDSCSCSRRLQGSTGASHTHTRGPPDAHPVSTVPTSHRPHKCQGGACHARPKTTSTSSCTCAYSSARPCHAVHSQHQGIVGCLPW